MITWEEAETLISAGFQKRHGRAPTAIELHGLAALSSVMSNFGYHFRDSPDTTDHNWSGMTIEALFGIKGFLDTKTCAAKGGTMGDGYYKGNITCYVKQDSDAAGIDDLLFQLENKPDVYPALAQGMVANFAIAMAGVGIEQPLPEWNRYRKAVLEQFPSSDPSGELKTALILHLQDLEAKTGQTTGWVVDWQGLPVGQAHLQGPNVKSGGSDGASSTDSGSSSGAGWAIAGLALVAVIGAAVMMGGSKR